MCFFHKRYQDERIKLSADRARRANATFVLPLLEDANSIQMSIMQIMRLILTGQIEHKTASLLLYALQTASSNLRSTNFNPQMHNVILDPSEPAITPLNYRAWEDNEFEPENGQTEEESAADRAIRALEKERKEKVEKEKWMRWAEMKYPWPKKNPPKPATAVPSAPAAKPAAVTPAPPATPATPAPKKPAASLTGDEVRAQLRDMIRKSDLPGMKEALAAEKLREEAKQKEREKKIT